MDVVTGGARCAGRPRAWLAGLVIPVLAGRLLVSSAGWAVTTAIAVYAFDRAGPVGVTVIALARLLSAAVAAPGAGALLERCGRAHVVAASCVAQAGCLVVAAALLIAGWATGLVAAMALL